MTPDYATMRERALLHEESFADFLYLDTRGFLTSGLGYLYVRDASGTEPGAAVQAHSLSMLAEAGISMTPAQQGTVDGLVRGMNALAADYTYPSSRNLALFGASDLGRSLATHLKLVSARTASGAFTFKVAEAMTPAGFVAVEPLFADPEAHSAYFALYVRPYEDVIDRALKSFPSMKLSDSQRVGFFSAVWNLPSTARGVVDGLSRRVSTTEMQGILRKGRGMVSPERIALEADLITGRRQAADLFDH